MVTIKFTDTAPAAHKMLVTKMAGILDDSRTVSHNDPKARKQTEARLQEMLTVGREKGWNR